MTKTPSRCRGVRSGFSGAGFTLLEMMVALAIFLLVSSVAFTLFNRQQSLLVEQQGLAGLNIGLRNALTQIQLDLINAANGVTKVVGPYVPAWPVGVTLTNQAPTTACNVPSTYTYTSTCFDTLNIIISDPQTPAWHVESDTSGSAVDTSTQNTLYAIPAGSYLPATYAANFAAGDTVLLVSSSGSSFTTLNLTTAGVAYPSGSPTAIKLTYTSTSAAGINPSDNYMLTTYAASSNSLAVSYTTSDWLVRLTPITYSVDSTTDTTNPKLQRQVNGGTASVVMEQVVGFRVGANVDNTNTYYYNAASDYTNNFSAIRSVRVSLIGRSKPNSTNRYRNQFDGGPYHVLGSSIIVNPRNLTLDSNE